MELDLRYREASPIITGDLIIDWIKGDRTKPPIPYAGGVGNLCRGLTSYGISNSLRTVWNPTVAPVELMVDLTPDSIQDFDHINLYYRDYTYPGGRFKRFRSNLRTRTYIGDTDFAVLHEDTFVRNLTSCLYADVRDINAKGRTKVLRLSSTDPFSTIMENWEYELAIVTYFDKVDLYTPGGKCSTLPFVKMIDPIDTIGAGDAFNVGFIRTALRYPKNDVLWYVSEGIHEAHVKCGRIGVFAG
jgi:hypothetical protein